MDASQSKSKTNKLDDVATSRLINDLKKRNALQKANTDLREKLRLAIMENRQNASTPGGKRRMFVSAEEGQKRKGATHHGGREGLLPRDENLQGMLKSFANTTNNVKHDKKTKELVGALRNRLVTTEKRLQRLLQENNDLRVQHRRQGYCWHQQPWPPYGGHAGASARAAGQDGAADALNSRYEHPSRAAAALRRRCTTRRCKRWKTTTG